MYQLLQSISLTGDLALDTIFGLIFGVFIGVLVYGLPES